MLVHIEVVREDNLQQRKTYLIGFNERMLANHTVEYISKAADISKNTLYSWRKRGIPDPIAIEKISKAINVSDCWLGFGHGARDREAFKRGEQIGLALEQVAHEKREQFITGVAHLSGVSVPAQSSPGRAPYEYSPALPEVSEVQRVLADLLEHESVLAVGTKAQISVKNASTLLDRLVVSLRSALQSDSHKDSAASSPAKALAHEKQSRGQGKLDLS